MPFINLENKSIYYEFINQEARTDKKPTIIFLHNGLGSVESWKNFPKTVCKTLELPGFVYDRYGHGKSDELKEERDVFFINKETQFLKKLLEELKITGDKIIFGHSDGATISLLYAGLYPEKVKAVISEAHHVVIEEKSQEGVKKILEEFKEGDLKTKLEKYHGEKTETLFYSWAKTWISNEAKKWTALDVLKNIKAPVLSLQGENDEYGSVYQLKIIEFICPYDKEIHELSNCGHIPHSEKKEDVLKIVQNFLKKHLPEIS